MDATLNNFAGTNPGFDQFVSRYEVASADQSTRAAYRKWEAFRNMDLLELQLQRSESFLEGETKGEANGIAKMIKEMLIAKAPEETVWLAAQNAGFNREQYEKIKREVNKK